jgi:hypothetical protein
MKRAWRLLSVTVITLILCVSLILANSARSQTVKLSVDASEAFGNFLSYQWRATDGHIVSPNAQTTDWILPKGPGIHFAYVLVSNGPGEVRFSHGGFTEGHIAVNTDENPGSQVIPRDHYDPGVEPFRTPTPDPADPQIKGTVRLQDGSVCGTWNPFFDVYVTPEIELFAFIDDMGTRRSQSFGRATLNPYSDGQFAIAYQIPDGATNPFIIIACGGTATLIDNFSRTDPTMNNFVIKGSGRPEIKSMTAVLNGRNIGIFPVPPAPPPGILPSDDIAEREDNQLTGPAARFLAFKGLDTRAGSCQYYKVVGAVEDCDGQNYIGAVLTFDEWRKAVQIDEFCTPFPDCFPLAAQPTQMPAQASAVFVNKTDLNLTRDHHSIAYGTDQMGNTRLAAYVCNHPGPAPDPATDPTGLFPSPSAIDAAIDAVLRVDAAHPQGRNLVACVAMDRGNGVNFTRFLIFGPSGDLLPSVNLDGNGEKFVPGACVACHGGTQYFAAANGRDVDPFVPVIGGFPEDGSVGPDLQAYFLPYDVDNFEFHSSREHYTKDDQQEAIYVLNLNAKQVNVDIAANANQIPAQATAFDNLFNGWYPPRADNKHIFDGSYFPAAVYNDDQKKSFYKNVVARSCRTCHIAMDQPTANFELSIPLAALVQNLVCGRNLAGPPQGVAGREASYPMPNSRVTLDRFWLSDRAIAEMDMDQPRALRTFYNFSCDPP